MRPALAPGDLVIVAVGKRAAVGQIALLDSRRHGAFLHRVIGVNRDRTLRTKGDANPVVDFDGLPATAVVGPVVLVAPVGQAIERYRHRACATMTAQ